MRAQPLSSSRMTWTTFCRGDVVHVCTDQGDVLPPVEVVEVVKGCVQTVDGRRWQQGSGQQIVCVLEGRPQVSPTQWIAPAAANDPTLPTRHRPAHP